MTSTLGNPLLLAPDRPLPARLGIVGAGTIGPDIGYYLKSALPALRLVLVDVAPEALARATARIQANADKGRAKGKLSEEQHARVREGIETSVDYAALEGCDWVIEAATENLPLKRKIFAAIEERVGPETLITSNTSSLPAARLFHELRRPARATVTHFFAPAFQNPAVEVISWPRCDAATVAYLRWLFATTGKVPLVTEDAPCFMLDRIFDNWCNEAGYLLAQATAAEIDSVAEELVHAGPFHVLNLAHGNPIIVETNTLQMEEGEHYRPADIFRSVEAWRTSSPGKPVAVDPVRAAAVRDRLLGIVFSQSFDIVDRGIGSAADLELGCALALGFKKGPFDLMAEAGPAEVGRVMQRLGRERPGLPQPRREVASYTSFPRYVLVDDVEGVKVLTLRRPQALNALDDRMTDEILEVLCAHENDPAVAGFVLTGYGPRAFCAGADIGRFPKVLGDADAAARYARDCSRLLLHLDAMGKPVVAALNGMALGGGLELALRCHDLVAVGDAWLQLPEVTLGIAPGIGGMVVPYRRWPAAAAVFHDMMMGARKLRAPEARELGVVGALAQGPDELLRLAVARVRALHGAVPRIPDGAAPLAALPEPPASSRYSREVVGIIARAIREAASAPTLAMALEIGYRAFGATACTAAAREGVTAFLEKRPPDFGRTG